VTALVIKDRIILGMVAGAVGNLAKVAVDEIGMAKGLSDRSYRTTAAGVWVSTHREAVRTEGQVFGAAVDLVMSMIGGIGLVALLSATGKDHHRAKSAFYGLALGEGISAVLSSVLSFKVRAKTARGNLSYMASHLAYGLAAGVTAVALGDPAVFGEDVLEDTPAQR